MCSSFPGLLIGRTAVHSGKDPAFVAYDQFLSTGILQPLSRDEVRCGSKPVKLGTSKCFQVCPRKRTYLPICLRVRCAQSRDRGAFRSNRTDRGAQVLPLAGATAPPWLPAKSAHVSNLPACSALGPPASAAQYSCRREPCTGRSAWLPLGRVCPSAWIEPRSGEQRSP